MGNIAIEPPPFDDPPFHIYDGNDHDGRVPKKDAIIYIMSKLRRINFQLQEEMKFLLKVLNYHISKLHKEDESLDLKELEEIKSQIEQMISSDYTGSLGNSYYRLIGRLEELTGRDNLAELDFSAVEKEIEELLKTVYEYHNYSIITIDEREYNEITRFVDDCIEIEGFQTFSNLTFDRIFKHYCLIKKQIIVKLREKLQNDILESVKDNEVFKSEYHSILELIKELEKKLDEGTFTDRYNSKIRGKSALDSAIDSLNINIELISIRISRFLENVENYNIRKKSFEDFRRSLFAEELERNERSNSAITSLGSNEKIAFFEEVDSDSASIEDNTSSLRQIIIDIRQKLTKYYMKSQDVEEKGTMLRLNHELGEMLSRESYDIELIESIRATIDEYDANANTMSSILKREKLSNIKNMNERLHEFNTSSIEETTSHEVVDSDSVSIEDDPSLVRQIIIDIRQKLTKYYMKSQDVEEKGTMLRLNHELGEMLSRESYDIELIEYIRATIDEYDAKANTMSSILKRIKLSNIKIINNRLHEFNTTTFEESSGMRK